MDINQRCTECGSTAIVEDHAQGNLVCTSCATVLESHVIDESAEWRSFADKDKESTDMTRTGGVANPLMTDTLGTSIGDATKGNTSAAGAQELQRTHRRGGNADQTLLNAISTIRRIAEALGLNQRIQDRAGEVYKQALPLKLAKGRGSAAACVAVVYKACALEGVPRTFKELLAVVPEASTKKVSGAYTALDKYLKDNHAESQTVERSTIQHPADLVRRFGSRMGFVHRDLVTAQHIAEAACPRDGMRASGQQPWDSRHPITIAGGVLYMLSQLPGVSAHPSLYQISKEVGMAEGTIQGVYGELSVYKAQFLPASIAKKL